MALSNSKVVTNREVIEKMVNIFQELIPPIATKEEKIKKIDEFLETSRKYLGYWTRLDNGVRPTPERNLIEKFIGIIQESTSGQYCEIELNEAISIFLSS